MQLALHRLVCEVVTHLCAAHNVGDLTVHLRSGQHAGRRWAVVRIDALFSADSGLRVRGGPLLHRLAATGLGMDAIRDRAALYEGTIKVHTTAHGECISMMVYDEADSLEQVVLVERTTPEIFSFS
jgi:signal transduction histidine kinase